MCEKCTEIHQMWDDFATHQITNIPVATFVPQKVEGCPKHQGNELKFYCETCQELICTDCTVQLHQGHQYDLVTDTLPKHRNEILSHLQPVREHIDTITKALHGLDIRTKEITDQRSNIEASIQKRIDQLHRALEQRKVELIGHLDQLTQEKLTSLVAKKKEIELLQTQLSSCLEYAEGSLKPTNGGEILAMKAPVIEQIQETMAQFNPDTLIPEQEADILLTTENMASLAEACRTFAEITESVDPSKCYTTGEGLLKATCTDGKEASVTLHAMNKHGKEYHQPVVVAAKLVCCKDDTVVECDVKHEGKSEYRIRFQPVSRGKHQLHITVKGKHTKGSPHRIVVKPHLETLGNPITTIGNLSKPYGIATDSKGRIIVAENGANKASVFSSEGALVRSFGTSGAAKGQFNCPCGVTVDSDDNIYVIDSGNNRIQKFTPDGRFVTAVGSKGRNPLMFNSPVGIGYNNVNDKLYVCDQGNCRVQILDRTLAYVSTFGNRGTGNGQFSSPTDVAFDEAGNVHIADNNRVCVFTPKGQFLKIYQCSTYGLSSITIDHDSAYVYTTEQCSCCIRIFTTQGQYTVGYKGIFQSPQGVCIDENDFIMVTDINNGCIQIH